MLTSLRNGLPGRISKDSVAPQYLRGDRYLRRSPFGSSLDVTNVQSADPGEVMRAVRRWARANGGSGPFTRGLDRSTA
jgi:hypothetical protein